jgi:hypothetical protein
MNTTRFLMLLTVATLAACGRGEGDRAPASKAAAAPSASTEQARYADENRDGRVSRDEARADPYLAASFDRYDANANDELDRAEFARLEARAAEQQGDQQQTADGERHQLRPRREFPRPYD